MIKRARLDHLLVERGLAATRAEARRRILAGEVLLDDKPVTKAGALVPFTAPVRLTRARVYVGRGGDKLEKALAHFAIEIEGRVALDVGASTGGFTHCLLAAGATRVYAVDVGRDQIAPMLRAEPRVVVFEKTDIRRLKPDELPETPDIATIDASFIS